MPRLPIGGWTLLAAGAALAILSAPVAVAALLVAARLGASRRRHRRRAADRTGPDPVLDALSACAVPAAGGACVLFAAEACGVGARTVARMLEAVARADDLVIERPPGRVAFVARGVAREVDLAALVCRCQAIVEDGTGDARLSAGLALSSRGASASAVLHAAERALEIALARGPGEIEMADPGAASGSLVEAPETSPLLETWIEPRLRAATHLISAIAPVPRWRHPALGLLEASDIIDGDLPPDAAATLFLRLLAEGLDALDRLDPAGGDGTILSIGLPGKVAGVSGLAARLAFAIDRADIAPERVELRLFEAPTGPELAGLARTGCRIAAPPEVAATLPPELFGQSAPALLLEAALRPGCMRALSRSGREIVALGITDVAEIADLAAAGATQLQGPAIAEPRPISELGDWFAERRASAPVGRSSGLR